MDTLGNFNHAVSMVGYLIFESNYKNTLPSTLASLNLICSPFLGEGLFSRFETVFFTVRYINNTGKLKIFD